MRTKHPRVSPRPAVLALRAAAFAFTIALATAPEAWALDKEGSAHGGAVAEASSGFVVSGGLMLGVSLYNPSYAARPDNTGTTLMRYAAHADVDILGRRLSIPLDANVFTDRELTGAAKFRPTELDAIVGVTTTWALGPGAIELGSRFEQDRPVDRGDMVQSYVDVRARYLASGAAIDPQLGEALGGGDVSGWATLGVFAYNPTYYARPDNTGRALMRYGLHGQLSLWNDRLALAVDGTVFTDRTAASVLRPTELDLTPELIARLRTMELHLAYERDLPLDRGGLTQSFVYLLGVWSFASAGG
jgi:hypothetical protein